MSDFPDLGTTDETKPYAQEGRLIRQVTMAQRFMGLSALWCVCLGLNIGVIPQRVTPVVTVARLALSPLPLVLHTVGHIEAQTSVTVLADFDGPVSKKAFKEGDRVTKGQPLLALGREKLRATLRRKQASFDDSRAEYRRARKDLRLQRALFNQQAVAYSSVEDAKRSLDRSARALETAEDTLHAVQKMLRHNALVAPLSGVVTKDGLRDSASLTRGREIATISDLSAFLAVAAVPPADAQRLQSGQPASVRISAPDAQMFEATVVRIGATDPTHMQAPVPVTLLLRTPDGLMLRLGGSADVEIAAGQSDPVLCVPTTAVVKSDGPPRVWVLDARHRLRSRIVGMGRSTAALVEITQGLRVGDTFALHPDGRFAEGLRVFPQ